MQSTIIAQNEPMTKRLINGIGVHNLCSEFITTILSQHSLTSDQASSPMLYFSLWTSPHKLAKPYSISSLSELSQFPCVQIDTPLAETFNFFHFSQETNSVGITLYLKAHVSNISTWTDEQFDALYDIIAYADPYGQFYIPQQRHCCDACDPTVRIENHIEANSHLPVRDTDHPNQEDLGNNDATGADADAGADSTASCWQDPVIFQTQFQLDSLTEFKPEYAPLLSLLPLSARVLLYSERSTFSILPPEDFQLLFLQYQLAYSRYIIQSSGISHDLLAQAILSQLEQQFGDWRISFLHKYVPNEAVRHVLFPFLLNNDGSTLTPSANTPAFNAFMQPPQISLFGPTYAAYLADMLTAQVNNTLAAPNNILPNSKSLNSSSFRGSNRQSLLENLTGASVSSSLDDIFSLGDDQPGPSPSLKVASPLRQDLCYDLPIASSLHLNPYFTSLASSSPSSSSSSSSSSPSSLSHVVLLGNPLVPCLSLPFSLSPAFFNKIAQLSPNSTDPITPQLPAAVSSSLAIQPPVLSPEPPIFPSPPVSPRKCPPPFPNPIASSISTPSPSVAATPNRNSSGGSGGLPIPSLTPLTLSTPLRTPSMRTNKAHKLLGVDSELVSPSSLLLPPAFPPTSNLSTTSASSSTLSTVAPSLTALPQNVITPPVAAAPLPPALVAVVGADFIQNIISSLSLPNAILPSTTSTPIGSASSSVSLSTATSIGTPIINAQQQQQQQSSTAQYQPVLPLPLPQLPQQQHQQLSLNNIAPPSSPFVSATPSQTPSGNPTSPPPAQQPFASNSVSGTTSNSSLSFSLPPSASSSSSYQLISLYHLNASYQSIPHPGSDDSVITWLVSRLQKSVNAARSAMMGMSGREDRASLASLTSLSSSSSAFHSTLSPSVPSTLGSNLSTSSIVDTTSSIGSNRQIRAVMDIATCVVSTSTLLQTKITANKDLYQVIIQSYTTQLLLRALQANPRISLRLRCAAASSAIQQDKLLKTKIGLSPSPSFPQQSSPHRLSVQSSSRRLLSLPPAEPSQKCKPALVSMHVPWISPRPFVMPQFSPFSKQFRALTNQSSSSSSSPSTSFAIEPIAQPAILIPSSSSATSTSTSSTPSQFSSFSASTLMQENVALFSARTTIASIRAQIAAKREAIVLYREQTQAKRVLANQQIEYTLRQHSAFLLRTREEFIRKQPVQYDEIQQRLGLLSNRIHFRRSRLLQRLLQITPIVGLHSNSCKDNLGQLLFPELYQSPTTSNAPSNAAMSKSAALPDSSTSKSKFYSFKALSFLSNSIASSSKSGARSTNSSAQNGDSNGTTGGNDPSSVVLTKAQRQQIQDKHDAFLRSFDNFISVYGSKVYSICGFPLLLSPIILHRNQNPALLLQTSIGLGHIVQIVLLTASYLNVNLLYRPVFKGSASGIYLCFPDPQSILPLYYPTFQAPASSSSSSSSKLSRGAIMEKALSSFDLPAITETRARFLLFHIHRLHIPIEHYSSSFQDNYTTILETVNNIIEIDQALQDDQRKQQPLSQRIKTASSLGNNSPDALMLRKKQQIAHLQRLCNDDPHMNESTAGLTAAANGANSAGGTKSAKPFSNNNNASSSSSSSSFNDAERMFLTAITLLHYSVLQLLHHVLCQSTAAQYDPTHLNNFHSNDIMTQKEQQASILPTSIEQYTNIHQFPSISSHNATSHIPSSMLTDSTTQQSYTNYHNAYRHVLTAISNDLTVKFSTLNISSFHNHPAYLLENILLLIQTICPTV